LVSNMGPSLTTQRWNKSANLVGTRATTSFSRQDVRSLYFTQLDNIMPQLAAVQPLTPLAATSAPSAVNPVPFSGIGAAMSTDWAILLSWCMDKWFLHGIPYHNLIPDPAFVPKESIRTFYVDQTWFRVFLDGALSVSGTFTDGDEVRTAIKSSLTTYLQTYIDPVQYPYYPQIPIWGFFLRSTMVSRFPDLRILAPRSTSNDPRAPILRMDRIDEDLLLVLFDREPGDFGPAGITIQPPEHQLTFGLSFTSDGTNLTMNWRKVFDDLDKLKASGGTAGPVSSYPSSSATVFDFDSGIHALVFPGFSQQAFVNQDNLDQPSLLGPSALVGSQLIARINALKITDSSQLESGDPVPNKISSLPRQSANRGPPPLQANSPAINSTIPIPQPAGTVPEIPKIVATMYVADKTTLATLQPAQAPPAVDTSSSRLQAQFFSVTSRINASASSPFTKLYSFIPLSLGIMTDLHVRLTCVSGTLVGHRVLNVQVTLGVGSVFPGHILAPFPPPQTTPTATDLTQTGLADFPHRSNTSGTKFPKVRFVGIGKRWKATASFIADGTGTGTGSYIVTIIPSYTDASTSGDLSINPDLSFVVEDVQLNAPTGSDPVLANVIVAQTVSLGNGTAITPTFYQVPIYAYNVSTASS
jgi:hypothetical protein